MLEHAARRHEIERLRLRAERHRQVAQSFVSLDDARAAREEAMAVEREANRLETALSEARGENMLTLRVVRAAR